MFAIEKLSQQAEFIHIYIIYPSFSFCSLICLHTLYVHLFLVLTASIKPVDFASSDPWFLLTGWCSSPCFECDWIGYQHSWRCVVFICQISAEKK